MVAIVTGAGIGLARSSADVLGARGQIGSASFGRGSEQAYVNAATGNLVITRQDEFLVGLGPDVAISRTYNSRALLHDGDNGDNWRMSPYRRIIGTVGAASVTRVDWDGTETVFTQIAGNPNLYRTTDGGGATDEVFWLPATSQWMFRDTNSRGRDYYDASGRLVSTTDLDFNTLTYAYSGDLISSVTNQNGERTDFVYGGTGGTQLLQITTQAASSSVRVRYGYDGSNRLQTVTVDLSPGDGSIADGNTYVTTYGYDGASNRVASIAQSDGSLLQIGYTANGSEYRVTSLTETVASGVTRVTGIFYDIAGRVTRFTDPLGATTTIGYDAQGNLTNLATPGSTTSYTYNASGDVTSMTENGRRTDYEYDSKGNQTLSRDAAGNTIVRTYGVRMEVVTSTLHLAPDPDGAGAGAASDPVTTRYAHDDENHLRYEVSADGGVTEYRYDRFGQRVSVLRYRDASYDVSGLAATASLSEATLNAWVSALADKSNVQRTDTFYDFRGNVTSEASYASVSVFGEGGSSPLGITPGANATVVQQADGLFRITKTSGTNGLWDSDAHSTTKSEGDFTLRLRLPQAGSDVIGGVSTAPGNSAGYQNPDYGLFFMANGTVCYMESGSWSAIGTTYSANDNFWLTRVGSTISYYKGATLAAAMAAGPLRTRTGSAGALYFDSSIWTAGASLDVEFTPQAIVVGANTSVALQPDGMTRVTRPTGGGWDADARSTTRADGDFVLHLRPVSQNDRYVVAGVARSPAANASHETVDFAFYFPPGDNLYALENGNHAWLGTYKAGEDYWLTRVNGTISYYRGATLEAAVAAGALRTVGSVAGSFYFDSSLYWDGAVDVDFTPLPIANGVGTAISQQSDGLLRITKTGTVYEWDADARSTTRAAGDFVLRLRPGQNDKYVVGGVSPTPGFNASYNNVNYGLCFNSNGTVTYMEGGAGVANGVNYAAGDNFWVARVGSTISYYKGATLEAAMAAGALFTRSGSGVSGTYAFDSSFFTPGGILDVSFTETAEVSRTNYVYSPSGQLLSRVTAGSTAQETFVYDGLGRLVSTTDMANATTSFLFNDAASTTTATLASGLTRVAVYNKAGELVSVTESGAGVPTAVTNYLYDGLGRLRMTTNPNGTATYFVYDSASRKVADVTADGSVTEYAYDSDNRLVKTVGYINKLSAAQIAMLDDFTAAGAGGVNMGGIGTLAGPTSLLTNGSFETSGSYTATSWGRSNPTLPGWTKLAGEAYEQVDSGHSGINATDGVYWLDLDGSPGTTLIPIGSNLLVNGSFDTSGTYTTTGYGRSNPTLPGWVKAGGSVYEQVLSGFVGVNATDGAYWLDLDSTPSTTFVATGSNLLVNGSFDTSGSYTQLSTGRSNATLPGWTKANAETFEQVASGQMGVTAAEGAYWLDLESVPGPLGPVGSNLIVNGSFEQSGSGATYQTSDDGYQLVINGATIPGWSTLNYPNIEQDPSGVGGVAASDGSYWLDMESNSTGASQYFYQNISGLTNGQTYQLKLDHANRAAAAGETFKVYWRGSLVATVGATGTTMLTETYQVVAGSGNNELMFESVGTANGKGPSVDNVRLFLMQPQGGGGNMDISQAVTGLAAGQVMKLQFNHANRTTAASGSFEVWWNNALVATVTDTGTTMLEKSYDLTAVAGTNTLRFKSLGTVDLVGASIDNVRLFATVPGPAGGNMDISQTVSAAAAGAMQLQFDHANRSSAATGSFDVYWNGALVAQINSTGTTMLTKTYQVSAVAGNNTLRFVGTGTVDGEGASLDNVRLFAMGIDPNSSNLNISQTVSGLSAGQSLLLKFDHANRTSAASGSFEVYWNDQIVATIADTSAAMQAKTYSVTAIAGNNTLRFKSTGTGDQIGASLDNVRLFVNPLGDALSNLRPVAQADDRYQWNVYDTASRLIETIDGSGAATVFAYDGASRLVTTTALANRLAAATVTAYKSMSPTALALPTLDSVNDRVGRNFYDKDGLLVGTLDGEGYLTENVYDAANLLVETIRYATATAVANRASGSFATLKSGVTAPVNAKDVHNWYVYDGRGLLRAVVDGEGDLTRYHYTAAGDVDREVRGQKLDPAALIAARPTLATISTAAGGQVTEITSYTRDAAGKVLSEARLLSDGTSWTTLYAYDSVGRLTSRTEAAATSDARTFTQRYDVRGNLIGELGGEGSAALAALGANPSAAAVDNVYATWGTVFTYDAAGRLVARTEPNGVNAVGNRTIYFYRGNHLAFQANAAGEILEYRYNARGERTHVVAYTNRTTSTVGVIGGEVTAAVEAAAASLANASDSVSRVDYDVTGRVSQSIDPISNTVTYAYNAFGELETRTDPIDTTTSVQTKRLYDRRGLLLSETRDSAAGGLQLATIYAYDAFGRPSQVTDPAGRVRKTDYDRAGRVVLTTDARNVTQSFQYDGRGNVISVTDRNNATTTFAYDAFSRTTSSTTPGQITTTIKRNALGQTISIKDGALRETVYAYDKDGNLKSETDAAANLVQHVYDSAGRHKETIDARGRKTSYTYDAANRVLTEKVDDGGLNLITAYEYDAKGQRFKITDPANRVTLVEFDRNGRETAVVVDSGGFALRTEYGYDKSGRRLLVTEAAGTAAARITQYEYDRADRLLRSRVDPNGINLLTQFSYDAAGNVARKTDAAGFVTTYAYDAENRLVRTLDPEGGVVETFYDNEGRVAGTRRYANAGSAATAAGGAFTISVAADNGRDQVSAYVYDTDGRLRVSIDGVGRPTEYVYDGAGNVVRAVDYAGTIAYAIGDSLATVQSRIAPLANLTDNRTTRAVYDAANRQAYSIDATGQVTAFGYDGSGNLIKQIRYANLLVTVVDPSLADMQTWAANNAHAQDRVDRTFYDGAARAAFSVDAENYVTQYQYDSAGRLTAQIRHAGYGYATGDGVTTAALAAQIGAPQASAAVTAFAYDSAGRLTDTTDPTGSVTHLVLDALGQATDVIAAYNVPADSSTTHRVFDKAGRVQSETRAYGTPEYSTTSYVYDGMGRARYVTDGRSVITEYVYDGLGRCIEEIQPLNAGQTAHTYKQYDKFGNLVKLTDPRNNAALFHYDALDRLVWQTDPEGYVTKTTYTRGDEVASVIRYAVAVSGTTIAAPPAVAANAADATTTFTRDKLDRLKAVTDAENYTESYTLNAFGDRTNVTNKLNGTTVNTFDKRGLLLTETLPVGSTDSYGATVATNIVNKYDYDARGNRIKTTEALGIAGEQRITHFVYDKADRLKQKYGDVSFYALASPAAASGTFTVPTENYNYDARGNHVETTTSWGSRTLRYYDDLGRKTAEIETTSSTTLGTLSKWDYDANGNVVAARIHADPFTLPAAAGGPAPTSASAYRETLYTYDSNNRLTHSKVAAVRSGEYGSSYVSAIGDIVLETVYDLAGNVVQETDGRLNSVFSFYDKAGRKIAKVDQERYLTFYTLDGEGNVKTEERFANPVASVAVTSDPAALRSSVSSGAGNRVTQFTYDRNGRRKSETRLGVNGMSLTAGGQLQSAGADAQILYDYNGLGQVTRKTEANLDFTEYGYDLIGRQIQVQSAQYADYLGASVRRRTDTAYNALGNVTRSVERGKTLTPATDRITRYQYNAAGQLEQVTDAAGFFRMYEYDAAGNVARETYVRANSANVTTVEANGYRYDLRNRVITQSVLTQSGSAWSEGDVTHLRYNSFGEISGRGVNVVGNAYQETFDYDPAGRMWRSTSGDGTVRLYAHDKAGNANLAIASAGDNLAALSLESALAAHAAGGAGVATTATLFDKRGQATGTVELQRKLAEGVVAPLTASRAYNAFGEVKQETDARGKVTDYTYNSAGKLTKLERPTVDNRTAAGALVAARPTENYSYDLSGRLIGVEDANNKLITRKLLTGTGYGGEEAVVLAEYLPDGINAKAVDEFGQVRSATDGSGRTTGYAYDKMGRLTQTSHAGGLIDYYSYDGLGQRLVHSNNFLTGAGSQETTDYDRQGRVTKQVAFGGDVTTTGYVWDGSISTAGLGTFGGWITTTTYANTGLDLVRKTDLFGRETSRTDLGDHVYSFTYDVAGRLAQRSGGGTLTYTYFNTGLLASVSDGAGGLSTYGYDAGGNKTSEYAQKNYAVVQNATAGYDALGRMTSWAEAGNTATPASSAQYEYDLVGNVRHTVSTQMWLDQSGAAVTGPVVHHWYQYDALNRVTTDKGSFVGTLGSGYISGGTAYTYDAAGRRITASSSVTLTKSLHKYVPSLGPPNAWYYDHAPYYFPDDGGGQRSIVDYSYTSAQVETYSYDAAGRLEGVTVAVQGIMPIPEEGTMSPDLGPLTATPRALYERDLMGRLKRQTDRKSDGTIVYDRILSYDPSGRISGETVNSLIGTDTFVSYVTNDYGSGSLYALGAPVTVSTQDYKNGVFQHSTTTGNSYAWWDGAVVATTSFAKTGQSTYYTNYYYDGSGQLTSVYIGDPRARTVTFTTDMNGQVIRRDEVDYTSTSNGDPHEIWYRFNGKQIAYTGNNGTLETDYATSVANRGKASTVPGGAFRWGQNYATALADYDPGFDPINSYDQGSTGGGYTVRAGDTLAGIAAALWGDSSLWYKLADANGLSAASALVEGQALTIPVGVQSSGHSASTFKPYDPAEVLGDTSPNTPVAPKPQKGRNKCGVFGIILLVVIAVAVTALTYGALTAPAIAATATTAGTAGGLLAGGGLLNMVAAGAIASVAGSIASQTVGVITGIQQKFSWKSVAIAGISGGISGGIGGGNLLPGIKSAFLQGAARGVATNVLTQGVSVATGLQKKFDWTAVAVAGVVSGTTAALSKALPGHARNARAQTDLAPAVKASAASPMNSFASSLGGAVAGAATRSVITGTSFGDNLIAVLPDVIGSTIGNMIGNALKATPRGTSGAGEEDPEPPLGSDYEGDGTLSPGEDPEREFSYANGDGRIGAGEVDDFVTLANGTRIRVSNAAAEALKLPPEAIDPVRAHFRPKVSGSATGGGSDASSGGPRVIQTDGGPIYFEPNSDGTYSNVLLTAAAGGYADQLINMHDNPANGISAGARDSAFQISQEMTPIGVGLMFKLLDQIVLRPGTEVRGQAFLNELLQLSEFAIPVPPPPEAPPQTFIQGFLSDMGQAFGPALSVVSDFGRQLYMTHQFAWNPGRMQDQSFRSEYLRLSQVNGQRLWTGARSAFGVVSDLAVTLNPAMRLTGSYYTDAANRTAGRAIGVVKGTLDTAVTLGVGLAELHDATLLYPDSGRQGSAVSKIVRGTAGLALLRGGGSATRLTLGTADDVGRVAVVRGTEGTIPQVRVNQIAGASREALVRTELAARYPRATVQNEVYLRTVDGRRAVDPLSGEARRIDSVVIRDGRVLDSVEVTSLTASKDAQILKELRIRASGGTFVRDRSTRSLIDISTVPTRIERRR